MPESSETTRQTSAKADEDIVRTAWRHAEASATLVAIQRELVPPRKSVTQARAKFLVG